MGRKIYYRKFENERIDEQMKFFHAQAKIIQK
jgi:hypothetical protein